MKAANIMTTEVVTGAAAVIGKVGDGPEGRVSCHGPFGIARARHAERRPVAPESAEQRVE